MLTLIQYTTATCAVCKAHKPMLAQIEKEFAGDLKVEYVDVNTLPENEARAISTVPLYKLLSESGTVIEIWPGTKSKEQIVNIIEDALG